MKLRHVIAIAASAALVVAPTALPALAYAEGVAGGDAAVAVQAEETLKVNVHDATIDASQLKGNLTQLKYQLKDLMFVSATKGDRDVSGMVEAAFNRCNPNDLTAKKPGTYTISFFYGGSDEVATATLTVTDSSSAAAPKLADETVVATNGGVLLTVMGQGVTDEPHALPAGSFSVGDATQEGGVWLTTVTINSSAISKYYEPLVPAVAQGKVSYDAAASLLTATFKWDADAQAWVVETPAKVTFNVTLSRDGSFEFADSATVTPADVKGLSTDKLIALIKEKLVKKAEVGGESVVDSDNFKVMLYNQLRDLQDGKPGTYEIGFMYDGDGYNNEVVGTAKLVVREEEELPTPSTEPTTPGATTVEGSSNGATSVKPASARQTNAAKTKRALPQTGDGAAIAGLFAAAGAATCAFGALSKRARGDR